MLAKGRLLGIQFYTLFKDGLYFEISKNAIEKANRIAAALKNKGVEFFAEPESNQIFPIFSNSVIAKIGEKYKTAFWEKIDENSSAIRICTSWATTDENTDRLIEDIILYLEQE